MNSAVVKERALIPAGKEIRWDLFAWLIPLVLANISLLSGSPAYRLSYQIPDVEAGEWWRMLTFPFVHVSWYNLLLDGSAFLMLYAGLEEENTLKRIAYVMSSIAGSILFPLFTSGTILETGLCGLSGCAHGLMAITGLELMRRYRKDNTLYRIGLLTVSVILTKGTIELMTGQVILSWLHFGDIGTPVAESHLGGALGGVLAFVGLTVALPHVVPMRKRI